MDSLYTCYDCVQYDYENDICRTYDYVELGDGICEDFIYHSEYEGGIVGYEDDGYPD